MKGKRFDPIGDYFNEVIYYGGLPMRRGDAITDLDIVAKNYEPKDHHKSLRIRDAGLMGLDQFNKSHPMPPNTKPLTLPEFYQITGAER